MMQQAVRTTFQHGTSVQQVLQMPETTIKAWKRDATILHIVGFVMIMLRVGGLLIGRQAGGAAGWDQGQVTEHRTANGNPLFLLASFATSTLCVFMCKKCPSYLSMLNCASNKTNFWKGLFSYCYFGKKCIGNVWNMPFVADCTFSFFFTMDLILQQPMLMSITVGQRADPDCPVELV